MQNISQKFENFRNIKKKYTDKLVDYKVFIGDCPDKKVKENRFNEVENISREFKTTVQSLISNDVGTKKFLETVDKENEALTNQINSYKNTLKDIENILKIILLKKKKKKNQRRKNLKKKNKRKKSLKKKNQRRKNLKKRRRKKRR